MNRGEHAVEIEEGIVFRANARSCPGRFRCLLLASLLAFVLATVATAGEAQGTGERMTGAAVASSTEATRKLERAWHDLQDFRMNRRPALSSSPNAEADLVGRILGLLHVLEDAQPRTIAGPSSPERRHLQSLAYQLGDLVRRLAPAGQGAPDRDLPSAQRRAARLVREMRFLAGRVDRSEGLALQVRRLSHEQPAIVGGAIQGTVTVAGSGTPLANVYVDVYTSSGWVDSAQTDGSGSYSVSGLPAATYYAATWSQYLSASYIDEVYDDIQCPAQNCTITSGTPIVVSGVPVTGIDFALTPGGSISGVVSEQGSATPIDNAGVDIWDSTGDYLITAYTDGSGQYEAIGLPSGSYYATTWSQYTGGSYIDELYDDIACPGELCSITSGTPIAVTQPSTTTGIDFALAPAGWIAGTVLEQGSAVPLQGVYVDIYTSTGYWLSSGYTDASGDYMAAGLPTGTYYAKTYAYYIAGDYVDEVYDDVPCPFSCDVTAGNAIGVTAPGTTSGIDFALVSGGALAGTVTADVGATPLAGIRVSIYDNSGAYLTYDTTDGSGGYTVGHLPAGSFFAKAVDNTGSGYRAELYDDIACPGSCDVTTGTPIAVSAASTTSGIDFGLARSGIIAGTVTVAGSGTPIEHLEVAVFNSSGGWVGYDYTDAGGNYSVPNLTTATYYARTYDVTGGGYINELYDDMPCLGYCTVTGGTGISVTDGLTTGGIDFALTPGGWISGYVTDASPNIANGGPPIADIEVDVYTSTGSYVANGFSNGSGLYGVGGLPTGMYFVVTYSYYSGGSWVDELYNDLPCPNQSCSVLAGTLVAVTAPATTSGIDFGLAPGGRIEGTVTEVGTGTPIEDVDVDIYDHTGSWIGYGYTDVSGQYGVVGIPTGTYTAVTWSNYAITAYIDELYDNYPCDSGCSVTTGTPIGLAAPLTTAGIDFDLWPEGACTSELLLDGSPVSTTELYEACHVITAGGTFGVQSPGDVTLRAGTEIVLEDGFFVEDGASCQMEIDPLLGL